MQLPPEIEKKSEWWGGCLTVILLTLLLITRWNKWWTIATVVAVSVCVILLALYIWITTSEKQESEQCKKEISHYEEQLLESIFEPEEPMEHNNQLVVGPIPNRTYRLDASMPDLGSPSEGIVVQPQRVAKWDLSFIPIVERGIDLFRVSGEGVDMNGRTNILRGYCRANGSRVYWREDHLSLKGVIVPKPYLTTGSVDFARGRFASGTWWTEKQRQGVYAREGILGVLPSDDPTEQQGGADRSSSYQPPSVQPTSIEKESIGFV